MDRWMGIFCMCVLLSLKVSLFSRLLHIFKLIPSNKTPMTTTREVDIAEGARVVPHYLGQARTHTYTPELKAQLRLG